MDLFQILALDERRLRRIGIDPQTIGLVFFACFASLVFSRLLDLELFLDRCLVHLFMLLLFGDKRADLALQVRSNLLCKQ